MSNAHNARARVLDHKTRGAFYEGLVLFVRMTLPDAVSGRTDEEAREVIEVAACEAVSFGLSNPRAIARYAALRLWLSYEGLVALRTAIARDPDEAEATLDHWLAAVSLARAA